MSYVCFVFVVSNYFWYCLFHSLFVVYYCCLVFYYYCLVVYYCCWLFIIVVWLFIIVVVGCLLLLFGCILLYSQKCPLNFTNFDTRSKILNRSILVIKPTVLWNAPPILSSPLEQTQLCRQDKQYKQNKLNDQSKAKHNKTDKVSKVKQNGHDR